MAYGYGRARGRGRGRSKGSWPGNGPFRDLPPWERPGWLYGPGSCWTLGYMDRVVPPSDNIQVLQSQKDFLENQLESIEKTLTEIKKRLAELEKEG